MERINPGENNFSKIKMKMENYERLLNALYTELSRGLNCPNGFHYRKKKCFLNPNYSMLV